MAGIALPGYSSNIPKSTGVGPANPDILFGSPSAYTSAANTQAADYDKMMKEYDDLLKTSNQNPIRPATISPIAAHYNPSSEVSSSLANLSSLSSSGGYSPQGIQDIRARAVSPIRAIYSAAQRNLDRSKALQGNYSPNYAVTNAKMARELSEQIGQQMTNIEGTIAQNQAQNRISVAPSFASAAANENAARTATERSNIEAQNRAAEINAQNEMEAQKANATRQQSIIEGMRQIYGTTPGLSRMYGDDVATAARLKQQQEQLELEKQSQRNNQLSGAYRFALG